MLPTKPTTTDGDTPTYASTWGGESHFVDIDGPTHYVDFGGPDAGTPIVLIHGLGGTHLNWVLVAPELAEDAHVMAIDLVGFGLTRSAGRSSAVDSNVSLVARFLDVVGRPAILVGNSMGGMISGLVASRYPEKVAGVVLIDPALPLKAKRPDRQVATQFLLYTIPGLGERYLANNRDKITAREQVQRTLDICVEDQSRIDKRFFDTSVELAAKRQEFPESDHCFLAASRSLMRKNLQASRYKSQLHSIDAPVLLIQGDKDRLVSAEAARDLAAAEPDWTYDEIPGVGHTPQIEDPQHVVRSIRNWAQSNTA